MGTLSGATTANFKWKFFAGQFNLPDMTSTDLARRLYDHPFKPFKIRLVDSTTYQIHEPWMVMVGESSAIVATETRKNDHGYEIAHGWRTVSIPHMMELMDLEPRSGSPKRKK